MNTSGPAARTVAQAFRRKMILWRFLRGFARLMLLATGVWVGVAGLRFFLGLPAGVDGMWLATVTGGAAAVALLIALWRAPTLFAAARVVDSLGETRDRLGAAVEFEGHEVPGVMHRLAMDEIREFLSDKTRFRLPGMRVPREWVWLCVPLVALGLIAWSEHLREERIAGRRDFGPAAAVAQELRKIAAETRATAQDSPQDDANADVQQLADRLEKAAAELADKVLAEPGEQQAAALNALSSAEAALAGGREAMSEAESAALKAALESVPGGEAAARALAAGDPATAAPAMDAFAREADADAMSQFARELNDAVRRMPPEQREQLMSRDGESARQTLQSAAQRMAQRGGAGLPPGERTRMSREVSDMKDRLRGGEGTLAFANGDRQQDGKPEPGEGGMAQVATLSESAPVGGTEDVGTTEDPFGDETPEAGAGSGETFVEGQQGEGEVLRAMSLRRADDATALREYRNVYEAAAAGAEERVLREEIPQGLRTTVREYFERIRPPR